MDILSDNPGPPPNNPTSFPPLNPTGSDSFSFFYDSDLASASVEDLSGEAHSKNQRLKRRKVDHSSPELICTSENVAQENNWFRYLVVEAVNPEESLSDLSPFAIQKGFEGIHSSFSNNKLITSIKPGIFLIKCMHEKVSKSALRWDSQTFVGRKIKVTPHRNLNTCRGVIYSKELGKEANPEEKLKSQGVIKVHNVTKKKGESIVPTFTFFLTFAKPSPPEYVTCGWENCKVSLFVPKPLQCFNCQRFGHPKMKCKSKPVCGRCGHEAHEGSCKTDAVCINCKGDHAPNSKNCPSYKKEAAIQKLRAEKKMSFADAKREVELSQPEGRSSYAAVTKSFSASQPCRAESLLLARELSDIPEAICAEVLTLIRDLRKSLREKTANAPSGEKKKKRLQELGNGRPSRPQRFPLRKEIKMEKCLQRCLRRPQGLHLPPVPGREDLKSRPTSLLNPTPAQSWENLQLLLPKQLRASRQRSLPLQRHLLTEVRKSPQHQLPKLLRVGRPQGLLQQGRRKKTVPPPKPQKKEGQGQHSQAPSRRPQPSPWLKESKNLGRRLLNALCPKGPESHGLTKDHQNVPDQSRQWSHVTGTLP